MKNRKPAFKMFWRLGWNGMHKVKGAIHNIPQDLLLIDTWVGAKVGQMCINDKGRLDIVKKVFTQSSNKLFNAHKRVHYVYSKGVGDDRYLVTVRKGKVFKRWGRTFKYVPEKD